MSTEQRTQQGPVPDGGREGPGEDMRTAGEDMSLPGAGGGALGADQSAEPVWRYQVPPPGSGTGAEQSNAGHYTANAAGHGGGIVSAPADTNVNAPGQPLSGAGSATDPAGGTVGGIQASREAQANGGAARGAPDMASNADGNMSGSAGTDRS
ncbi:hypothetical protein LK542_08005 [Massilia sp. IC2-477]|uniref:hypothetical protein n=1 Tax=Massilia sp. IC2-477 TaxID=2887198 RepID=UPI001D124AF7|nr:hypothetical protein [Massilia sp. IC2-477]MCC2955552.1 hypothetical protein [Massilia sp. IC2-477]